MKKYDTQAIKNFIYSSIFTTKFVETIVIMQIIACFIAFLFTYNQQLVIALLSPLALCSAIIYIFASKTNAADVKRINLLIGLSGIVATITCIISSVLIMHMDNIVLVKTLITLCLINITIMFFMVLHARAAVNPTVKKHYVSGAFFTALTALGFPIGKVILHSKGSDIHFAIMLLFMAFSLFFSITFVSIMRYHYAKILEKIENEQTKQ